MDFELLDINDNDAIGRMSTLATEIVREHYDPIIGKAQNDYMIAMFQSPEAIKGQLEDGARYYFVTDGTEPIGFLSYYVRHDTNTGDAPQTSRNTSYLYLSKFYLRKDRRGKGLSRKMLEFLIGKAQEFGARRIELNVNRGNSAIKAYEGLGFRKLREEKNNIGNGFFMDDYVYVMDVGPTASWHEA